MRDRLLFRAMVLIGLVIPITSCNTSPSLTSIAVTPTTMSFGGAGLTTQLTAMGSYTHPNHPAITKDITDQVTWASSTPECVTVSATGLITSGSNVCSNILVTASSPGFNGEIQGSMTVNVTQSSGSGGTTTGDVTSITVTPATQSLASIGETAQFVAIGKTSSGASVDVTSVSAWTSSAPSVAVVSGSGLATGKGAGTTTFTVVYTNADGTVATGSASLTVAPSGSPEPYASLAVVPSSATVLAVGQTAQFIAIATTGTGTTLDLTSSTAITWTSSNQAVGTVNTAGLVTAVGSGTTAITAVAKNPDGTVVASSATFTVSVPTSQEPLVSLAIVPNTQTAFAIGQSAQYIAIATTGSGTTVDETTQATWTASNAGVGTVGKNTGLATAVGAGTTALVAEVKNPDGTVVTGSASFVVAPATITEEYTALTIVPSAQTASSANETAQFIAIATTGAGTTVDATNLATWKSSDQSVGTVVAGGVATALSSGATAITAVLQNSDGSVVTGTGTFTVNIASTAEPLLSLAIIPTSQSVSTVGETSQYIAIGTFSGASSTTTSICGSTGTLQDCTSYVKWSSSDVKIATISNNGLATALQTQGTTAITAVAQNADGTVVTGVASLTLLPPSTGPVLQSTLGVTLIGTNASNGLVTAPSPQNPTGPNVINCTTAAGATCTQPFTVGSTVTLTATPQGSAQFGGWSNNCTPTAAINPTGANSCTITLTSNETVAAIFY